MALAIPLVAALLAPVIAPTEVPEDHPVRHDRTGIRWQIPFDSAHQRAREESRLLAIKPVAFGTTPDGCW